MYIRGTEDRPALASAIDERSGLMVDSLYTNGTTAPPDSTLRDLDVRVVNLRDIGTRTWTYVGSMLYARRASARRGLPIVVLDRPNPRGGAQADGPILDPSLANPDEPTPARRGTAFALYPTPWRHGMTMGELALLFNQELGIGVRLVLTDRERFSPGRTGAALLWGIAQLAGDSLVVRPEVRDLRLGRPATRESLMCGEDPDQVVARDAAAVAAWDRRVASLRLYR